MDSPELNKQIGKRIRQLREQKNISQQELAVLCDFEKSSMSRIEAGRTNPTIYTLYKISQALAVSVKDIIQDL